MKRHTSVVVDRGLPRRRLVFAGVRGDEWFVHYELGGIGHSYCVLLFKVDPQNRLQFVWGGAAVSWRKKRGSAPQNGRDWTILR